MAAIDGLFRALSDPTRREILGMLRRRDMSAGEIADRFPQARSTLSEHLKMLRDTGLVVTERQGTRIDYSLNTAVFEEAVALVMDALGVGRRRSGRR